MIIVLIVLIETKHKTKVVKSKETMYMFLGKSLNINKTSHSLKKNIKADNM